MVHNLRSESTEETNNSDQSLSGVQDTQQEFVPGPMQKIPKHDNEREGVLSYLIGGVLVIILAIVGFLALVVPILLKLVILLVVVRILIVPILVFYDHLTEGFGPYGAIGFIMLIFLGVPISCGALLYYGRRLRGKEVDFNSDEIVAVFIVIYLLSWVVALYLGVSL